MIKLDDLGGLLSVRSINTLKRLGYKYLEEVCPDKVEKRIKGLKTKREILEFINNYKEGNIMKNNNDYRLVIDNDTVIILIQDKTIKLTLLNKEGPFIYSKIKKEVYTKTKLKCTEIIDSFHFNNMEIWGVKDNVGDEKICNWYIDKEVL